MKNKKLYIVSLTLAIIVLGSAFHAGFSSEAKVNPTPFSDVVEVKSEPINYWKAGREYVFGDIGIDHWAGGHILGDPVKAAGQHQVDHSKHMREYYENIASEIRKQNYTDAARKAAQEDLVRGANEMAEKAGKMEKIGNGVMKGAELAGAAADIYGAVQDIRRLTSGKDDYVSETMVNVQNGTAGLHNFFVGSSYVKNPVVKGIGAVGKEITGPIKDLLDNSEFQKACNSPGFLDNDFVKNLDEFNRCFNGACINMFGGDGGQYYADQLAKRQAIIDGKQSQRPIKGAGVYKPNIYLYPLETKEVTVTFDYPGLLTRVIPDYPGSWSVLATPEGKLSYEGADYDFLFYEAETYLQYFQTEEGYYISEDGRSTEFKEILSAYGLNEKEIADFVEFWTQFLAEDTDYIMYPQLTEAVDGAMPVDIVDENGNRPDSIFRIWFVFEKANADTSFVWAKPEGFDRKGFSAVEWGGLFK